MSSSSVIFFHENRVLLVRRSLVDAWRPRYWDLPGGGIDPGETPLQAAARESYEEARLPLIDPLLFWIKRNRKENNYFYISPWNGSPIHLSEEHDYMTWVDPDYMNIYQFRMLKRVRDALILYRELRKNRIITPIKNNF